MISHYIELTDSETPPLFFLFLSFFFFFNWKIIALQWCGLCHTSVQISHNYIYISPSSCAPLPPSPFSRNIFFNVISQGFIREGNGTPLQYSCLENPMDRGAWWAAVHGVAGSWTRLSDFTFTFHFHALEKEMATHSSVLAWRIPGTGEPGGLPSMGSHRVGHDWSDLAAAAAAGFYKSLQCFT